ncbi:MAG: hypothetical protein GY765_30895 [bacterium]|nr:hypothetical protein [bacterium]
MSINTVKQIISPEEETQVLQNIEGIRTLLTCLTPLTNAERLHLVRPPKGATDFINEAASHAQTRPEFLPTYIPLADFEGAVALSTTLQLIDTSLKDLLAILKDTRRLLKSEAYAVGRMYYRSVKGASEEDMEGARQIAKSLARFFAKRNTKLDDEEEPPAGEEPATGGESLSNAPPALDTAPA